MADDRDATTINHVVPSGKRLYSKLENHPVAKVNQLYDVPSSNSYVSLGEGKNRKMGVTTEMVLNILSS